MSAADYFQLAALCCYAYSLFSLARKRESRAPFVMFALAGSLTTLSNF